MKQSQPIFKSIFGKSWDSLPPVMHKHYANRPYCDDTITAEGKMDIEFGWIIRVFSPFLRLFGSLVPRQGKDIPVTVRFRSQPNSNIFCLDRIFKFPNKKPYRFYSELTPISEDIVIEFMKYGLGWKHRYYYDGKKVILEHRGYVLKLFGNIIPVPLDLCFGRGYAEEIALNENSFRMRMNIKHALFGKMYEYRGVFDIVKE